MAKPKTYIDIGHGTGESFLWVYFRGRLDIRKTGSRTHEKIWGRACMNWWRGRYDGKTNRVSVTPPVSSPFKSAPKALIDLLEEHFGGDIDVWEFNPPRRARK